MSSGSGNRRARSILEKFIREPERPEQPKSHASHDHNSSANNSQMPVVLGSLNEDVSEPEQSLESVISSQNNTSDFTPDPIVNGKFY